VSPFLQPCTPCGGGSRPTLTPGRSPRPRPLPRSRRAAAPVRPAWSLATPPVRRARTLHGPSGPASTRGAASGPAPPARRGARSTGPSRPASTRARAAPAQLPVSDVAHAPRGPAGPPRRARGLHRPSSPCPTWRTLHGSSRPASTREGCTGLSSPVRRGARAPRGPAGKPRRARGLNRACSIGAGAPRPSARGSAKGRRARSTGAECRRRKGAAPIRPRECERAPLVLHRDRGMAPEGKCSPCPGVEHPGGQPDSTWSGHRARRALTQRPVSVRYRLGRPLPLLVSDGARRSVTSRARVSGPAASGSTQMARYTAP
jgi:hypothetical protein